MPSKFIILIDIFFLLHNILEQ